MGEIGKVININSETGMLTLSLKRGSACEGCKKCLASLNESEMIMEAENHCGAGMGDKVEVELKDGYFFRASLIMYGLPLLGLVIGAMIGTKVFESSGYAELWALCLGLACMAVVFLIIRSFDKTNNKKDFTPMAVNICDNEKNSD